MKNDRMTCDMCKTEAEISFEIDKFIDFRKGLLTANEAFTDPTVKAYMVSGMCPTCLDQWLGLADFLEEEERFRQTILKYQKETQ